MARNLVASPALSAESINKLVTSAVKLYRETVQLYLEAAMQDGHLPLTTPTRNKKEELAILAPQESALWQQAMAPDTSASVRMMAQRQLHRLAELRSGLAAPG